MLGENLINQLELKNVKIAYIGDFINHGKSLQTSGTPIVILLASLPNVEQVDVYCPKKNDIEEEFKEPEKVRVIESYSYNNFVSILKLLKIRKCSYDLILFNLLPTAFGNSSISNLTGLTLPLILRNFVGAKKLRVIYHNSVFTNDINKLGYNTLYDKIRSIFLKLVEKRIFKTIPTFVLLNLYKRRIDEAIKSNVVSVINARYLEAVTTVYINGHLLDYQIPTRDRNIVRNVIMHGSWGPQKNLQLGLETLRILKEEGLKFNLLISGAINHHFPEYQKEFDNLLSRYGSIIDKYLGYVEEKDIMNLFFDADLLILPYNTPGGHSGVLEQAIFFEVPTVAIDFPEYREQAGGLKIIKLVTIEGLYKTVGNMLLDQSVRTKILLGSKIQEVKEQIAVMLQGFDKC